MDDQGKVLIIFLVGIFLVSIISFFSTTIEHGEAIRAGLEECPIEPGSSKTIWVKDCNSYLKQISQLKENQQTKN